MPTAILPFLLIALVQAKVSLERVNKFMNNEELDADAVKEIQSIITDEDNKVVMFALKWCEFCI